MISNLQLPYHIVQTDDLAYKFITQSGVVYAAYFIDISEAFGADHVYTFSFDAVGKPVNDGRVRYTIVKILSDFFQVNQNSLIVVCETCDKKENARFRLFEKWYCQTGEHDIEKIDAFVDHADYNFRSSLLLFKEHPRYQEIKGIYDECVKSEMEK